MPSADNLNRRVASRIRGSKLTLTVQYPAARPAATGTAPGSLPVSPLTGPAPTTQVIPGPITPSKPAVGMSCLWTDMVSAVGTDLARDPINRFPAGWVEGASAVARVLVEDAALDVTNPHGQTVFTGCSHVEFAGKRFTVLSVKVPHASFDIPVSYYVWLVGASEQ